MAMSGSGLVTEVADALQADGRFDDGGVFDPDLRTEFETQASPVLGAIIDYFVANAQLDGIAKTDGAAIDVAAEVVVEDAPIGGGIL